MLCNIYCSVVVAVIALAPLSVLSDDSIGCYVPGECKEALYLEFDELDTPDQCHELCIGTTGCQFWTHYDDEIDPVCFAYSNCPEFDDYYCDDCISGEVDCGSQGTTTPQATVKIIYSIP